MQRWSWRWLLGGLVMGQVLAVASSAEAQPAAHVGLVTALEGRATVQREGSSTPQPLQLQSAIHQQDVVRTEAASKVQVTFLDDTLVSLGKQSTLEVTHFIYTPQRQRRTSLLTVSRGVLRAVARKLLPQASFEVTTPTAIAAIRGTDFMAEVTPEATAVVALEGSVAVFSVHTIFRGPVLLTEGMGSTVRRNQHPSLPSQWTKDHIDHLREATTIR